MPPVPALVRWRVAHDEHMQQVVSQGLTIAWPSLAHSVHVEVGGLEPGRWYYYQFWTATAQSPIGRTRTMPVPNSPLDRFQFAFVSCQDWQSGFYSAYRNLATEELDLVLHLGDYIYESGVDVTAPRQHDGPETKTLEGYRSRYALYKSDPHLQAAHAAFPWPVVPDDHEVDNNYANLAAEDGIDPVQFAARRANAYRAYYEHMPLRSYAFPQGAAMQLYRRLAVGSLLQFSALDTRQYRTDQPCGDSIRFPCAGMLDLSASMMGQSQEYWLMQRLHRSTARWNVIAQQTMFARFDFLAGGLQLFNMDQWDGYLAARHWMTQFLAARQPSNPIILAGDIHSSWVHGIKTSFADPGSPIVAVEFVGPSMTSTFRPALVKPVLAALPDNPHTRFFDGLFHGYVRCTVTPDIWTADIRAVPSILDEHSSAFTLSSWMVVDGQPGAVPATT